MENKADIIRCADNRETVVYTVLAYGMKCSIFVAIIRGKIHTY